MRLVSIGEINTPITRRIATRTEIGEANWREIAVPLSTERLLTTDIDERTGEETVEIVHDTLIKYWQRLTAWIEQHRHDLERIDEIETAANKWHKNQRTKQDLWTGKKLKEAQKFSKQRDRFVQLKPIAHDFLATGIGQQRWNRSRLLILGAIVPGILVGLGVRAGETHLKL